MALPVDTDLKITVEGDILNVIIPGYSGSDQAVEWFKTIIDRVDEAGLSKVLIDVRQMGTAPPVLDLYDLADQISDIGSAKGIRFGLLNSQETIHADKIFMTMATNRGLNVLVSLDAEEILAWLRR